MATIATTTRTDPVTGKVTVTKKVLTPVQVRSRKGRLQAKTIAAYNTGKGRRKMSPYQYRALGSAAGVLPADESVLTRQVGPKVLYAPSPRTGFIRYQIDAETDKERIREAAIKAAAKANKAG